MRSRVCERHAFDARAEGGAAVEIERAVGEERGFTRQKHGTRGTRRSRG
jgi:hypothetical protein